MKHPAFKAIRKQADGVLEAYENDLLVHDLAMIRDFPNASFLWFCRSTGTHIIPLGQGVSDAEDISYFNAAWSANSEHYFWNGTDLTAISHAAALELLKTNKPLKWQF